jgi:hypothetical protein
VEGERESRSRATRSSILTDDQAMAIYYYICLTDGCSSVISTNVSISIIVSANSTLFAPATRYTQIGNEQERSEPILFRGILIRFQYPLLDKILRLGPMLNLLLQAVRTHVLLELSLLTLQRRGGCGVGKNVACNRPVVSVSCQAASSIASTHVQSTPPAPDASRAVS